MKLDKNYHDYSMTKEKQLFNNLLIPYGSLLYALQHTKDLSKENINKVVDEWTATHGDSINDTLKQQVTDLEAHSRSIIKAETPLVEQTEQADALLEANKIMLDVTTNNVKQKFIEIGVNEKAYGHDSKTVNTMMDEALNKTVDSLETFSVQSTINNLAQFIKKSAVAIGYTSYRWRTQRDSRVRPTHAKMDGKWFDISDESPEPAGFKPGIDYGCRCWMWEFR